MAAAVAHFPAAKRATLTAALSRMSAPQRERTIAKLQEQRREQAEALAEDSSSFAECANCHREVAVTGEGAYDNCWGDGVTILCNDCGQNCDECEATTLKCELAGIPEDADGWYCVNCRGE